MLIRPEARGRSAATVRVFPVASETAKVLSKPSKHIANIRRARGIRKYRLFDLISGQIIPDSQSKDVDHLLDVWADDMSAKYAPRPVFYQRLVSIDTFGDPTSRIPVRCFFAFDMKEETRRAGVRLAHSNRGDRR